MKDPLLFTPGPLTTSATVKAAMQRDVGSRDADFIELVGGIRSKLLRIAGVSREQGYETVLMQGSGTFGLESVISSVVPRQGRFVVLANGAYGERMATIAERLGISTRLACWPENESPQPAAVQRLIEEEPGATHVAMHHCHMRGARFFLDEALHGCGLRRFVLRPACQPGGNSQSLRDRSHSLPISAVCQHHESPLPRYH